ncbi:uncharacterized protein LOC131259125 [Anopheles coustani]|uniref:uncharacterized protein LOC131259125 n=1 Tax=Anopheles coustani TaxID=139045 RepID=UPI00265A4E18|nr:uncharacterized protein LOC131259125 [Anopheles coustani]
MAAAAAAAAAMATKLADQRKVTEIILETERVADRILANKQELVELDKRRQETREALRVIEKHFPLRTTTDGDPENVWGVQSADEAAAPPGCQMQRQRIWITIGSMLVKQDRQGAVDLLRKDQQTTEADIERIRNEQKLLITKQRDLEHERPLRGFNLKPLSTAEIAGIRSNLPGF